jgi:hypothetical protein
MEVKEKIYNEARQNILIKKKKLLLSTDDKVTKVNDEVPLS